MKTIHWNEDFKICVAVFDGDANPEQINKSLREMGIRYSCEVNGPRRLYTIYVSVGKVGAVYNIITRP